jgi:hypothetical protein
MIARICALFKAYTGGPAWKAIGDRLLKPCYLSREDHNIIGKLGLENIRSQIGPLKTGINCLQTYWRLSPVN